MAKKKTLNEKRLTKKEVINLINTEGKLHVEYTQFFEQKYATGYLLQDKVYELSGERFLYAFDENGFLAPGKGDIYTKDYMLRRINWTQRLRDDYANNRGNSVDHWKFYSLHKTEIVNHVAELTNELAVKLKIDRVKLDGSYESLDLVSTCAGQFILDELFANLYDNLVIYVGEVIKKRVNGNWEINKVFYGGDYPFISIGLGNVGYMPINAVWSAMSGLEPINFRLAAANEIRSKASRVNFERNYKLKPGV